MTFSMVQNLFLKRIFRYFYFYNFINNFISLIFFVSILIIYYGAMPFVIKQSRVGLHGKNLICINLKQCLITHMKKKRFR